MLGDLTKRALGGPDQELAVLVNNGWIWERGGRSGMRFDTQSVNTRVLTLRLCVCGQLHTVDDVEFMLADQLACHCDELVSVALQVWWRLRR